MPIDFPSSPSNNQSYTYNNFVWVYNTTANAWISQGSTSTQTEILHPFLLMGA